MEDKLKRLAVLMTGYRSDELNDNQKTELLDWVALSPSNKELFEQCCNSDGHFPEMEIIRNGLERKELIWQKLLLIQASNKPIRPVKIIGWRLRISIAAAALLVFAFSVYLLLTQPSSNNPSKQGTVVNNDALPGGAKATLTLGDGREIVLNDQKDGQLAYQGNSVIVKKDNNINYVANQTNSNGKQVYNTLMTPKSGEYKVTLQDGTEVWLNSISQIRYPTVFDGKTRNVEIRGEAYFKVAKDPRRPFKISILSGGKNKISEVEVLGTEFNIMAYEDEQVVSTTLVEGSVRMRNSLNEVIIKPGQQVRDVDGSALEVLNKVDVDKETAWVKGLFRFNNTDLKTVMRQLARWYDIDVVYEKGYPENLLLNGEVPKSVNISAVLKVLEYMGARFNIEGKVVRVLAK